MPVPKAFFAAATVLMAAASLPTQVDALEMDWTFIRATASCQSPGQGCSNKDSQGQMRMVVIKDMMPETRWYHPVHNFKGQVLLQNVSNVTGVQLRMGDSTKVQGRIALALWPVTRSLAQQPISVNGTLALTFDLLSTRLYGAAGGFENFLTQLKAGNVYLSVSTAAATYGALRGQTAVDTTTQYYEGLPDYLWTLGYLP